MSQRGIQLSYDPNSNEGLVIEELKMSSGINISSLVRQAIYYIKGYEIIKEKYPEQLDNFCINAVQFFKGHLEANERRLKTHQPELQQKKDESADVAEENKVPDELMSKLLP